MTRFSFLPLIALLPILAPPAVAGHRTNNGGGAMVCRELLVPQAELLEFWEAQKLKRFAIREMPSVEAALERAQRNLKDYNFSDRWENQWGTPGEIALALYYLSQGIEGSGSPFAQHRLEVEYLDPDVGLE